MLGYPCDMIHTVFSSTTIIPNKEYNPDVNSLFAFMHDLCRKAVTFPRVNEKLDGK